MTERRLRTKPRYVRAFALLAAFVLLAAACGDDDQPAEPVTVTVLVPVTGAPGAPGAAGAAGAAGQDAPVVTAAPTTTAAPMEPMNLEFLLPFRENVIFLSISLADELGFFAEEGITVNITGTNGSGFVTQQVAAGRADAGLANADAVILGFSQAETFRVLFDVYSKPVTQVWVTQDSPLQSFFDIAEGDTIGVNDLAGGEALSVRMFLADQGLSVPDEVRLDPVGYAISGELEALEGGRVDALAITFGVSTRINILLDANLRCISCGVVAPVPGTTLIVKDSIIAGRPDVIAGLGRAMAKAMFFADFSPLATENVLKERTPEDWTNEESTRAVLAATIDVGQPRALGYGSTDLQLWQTQMALMLQPGTLTGLDDPIVISELVLNNAWAEIFNDFDQAEIEALARSLE